MVPALHDFLSVLYTSSHPKETNSQKHIMSIYNALILCNITIGIRLKIKKFDLMEEQFVKDTFRHLSVVNIK